MLPDQVTQLLTAFVDGELTQRERKAVMRLLHRSSEARELLRQLQENAHKVAQLPRRKVQPSMVQDVLKAIADQQTLPVQPAPRKRPRRSWAPYYAAVAGLAACVLLGLAGILYWKSLSQPDNPNRPEHPPIVKNAPLEKKIEPRPTPERDTPSAQTARNTPNPMLGHILDGTYAGFGAPIPVEQAFAASFSDLKGGGSTTSRLITELNRDNAVKLDIKVKNNSVAMERLKAALHEHGISIIVDADAAKTLKKPQAKIEYVVYAENLSTDEVTKLLKALSLPDTTGMGGSVPSPYEKVTVTPLAKDEKSQVNNVLGIDLSKPDKGAKSSNPPARWERKAVVLPVNASVKPSTEVQQFAKQRRRPQAGTVQLLIKIHQD